MTGARLREEAMKTQRRILLVMGACPLAVSARVTLAGLLPGGVVGSVAALGIVAAGIARLYGPDPGPWQVRLERHRR